MMHDSFWECSRAAMLFYVADGSLSNVDQGRDIRDAVIKSLD